MKKRWILGCALCAATVVLASARAPAEESWVDGPVMVKPDDPRPVTDGEIEAFIRAIDAQKVARQEARSACGAMPVPEKYDCSGRMVERAVGEIEGMSYARYVEIMTAVSSNAYPGLTGRVRQAVRQRNAVER